MNVGKAIAKHNHSIDFWGTPIDERKSDVQKAIRRGLVTQALFSFSCGIQMIELFPNNSTAKAIVTNFINRLIVIAVEDVSLANPRLVKSILPTLTLMSRKPYLRNKKTLDWIVTELANSPKSRLCSHLYNAYKDGDDATLDSPECFQWIDKGFDLYDKIKRDVRCKKFMCHY